MTASRIIPYAPGDIIVIEVPDRPPIMLHRVRDGYVGVISGGAEIKLRRIKEPTPLTEPMRRVIRNLSEGRTHDHHCYNTADYRGIHQTMSAMLERGLVRIGCGSEGKFALTPDGQAAAAELKAKASAASEATMAATHSRRKGVSP